MAFTPINYDDGKLVDLGATAADYTKGQALIYTSGYLADASTSAQEVVAVSMETKTIATTGDPLKCITTHGVRFVADCDAAPAQTDVGTECDLASGTTVNPDANSNNNFYVEGIVGAVGTSTKVTGYFKHENPNA